MSEYEEVFDSADNEATEAELRAEIDAKLAAFGGRLQALADKQVKDRNDIEVRWLDDMRAYHGKYDAATLTRIRNSGGSEAFINLTKNKCNAAESRLSDMLFPSDDRNWSLTPTPNPELNKLLESDAVINIDGQETTEKELAEWELEEAGKKAKEMQREIDDQLVEADYAAKCREAIHDAVVLGTGILKGPIVDGRVIKSWVNGEDGEMRLEIKETLGATVEVVSPWDYFPDMAARNKSECEFEFERKYLTRQKVEELLDLPGDSILREQVIKVLSDEEPTEDTDDSFNNRRVISGYSQNVTRSRYILWEYHGYISHEELEVCGFFDDQEETEDKEEYQRGITGSVLLLNGRVIRVSMNPLDTEESPYSVFTWERDANSIFGFGVPFMIRSPQKMLNASVRMMLDNSRLSVGPQIVMNKKLVTPADGSWQFSPYKRWNVNDETRSVREAVQFIDVPSNQSELDKIYQLSRMLIDEQSSMPAIATGEGDPNAAPQTATGVAITSGAAKVVFKRVVKNFDDNMIRPMIKRFYDWNMQYSDKNEIKGDMQVNALGSTSLMIREQEAQIMGDVLRMIDPREIMLRIEPEEAIAKFFKSRNISTAGLLKPEEEVEKLKEAEAQSGQMTPEQQKMQFDMQKIQMQAQQQEQKMMIEYEIAMRKLAAEQQTTVEKIKQQSGAIEMRAYIDQLKEQNRRQIEEMRIATQRQIAGVKAQQEANKQNMQMNNLQAGYDTF